MRKIKPWRLISKKDVSVGKWFPIEERVYEKSDGEVVDDFSVTTLEDVSMVIPILDTGRIMMVEQFKPGAGQVTYEFPAGRLKPGESFEDGARTELLEETGYEVGELVELGELVTFPTKASERVANFIGLKIKKVAEQKLDRNEEIEVVEFEAGEIDRMIRSGEINTSPSVGCWYLAKLKYGELFL